MRTLVIRPLQGYGITASLSYPDTWVRKPDYLHLPYDPPFLGSSPYNPCEDAFLKVSLARRAEPCTHNPQQQYRWQQQASKRQVLRPRTARTHHRSVVRDAHHSCKGSPVMYSMAQVSEANACKAWLTLWWTSGTYTQHSAPTRAHKPPWDAVSLSTAIGFCKATFLNWYTSSFNRLKESYVAFNAWAVCRTKAVISVLVPIEAAWGEKYS